MQIQCTLNNAEFPPKIDALNAFVEGPRFKVLKSRAFDMTAYAPYIVVAREDKYATFYVNVGVFYIILF